MTRSFVWIVALGIFTIHGYIFRVVDIPEFHRIVDAAVTDPGFVPTARTIRIASAGYDALVADGLWLSTVQYIGSSASNGAYRTALASLLNTITDIHPTMTASYIMGMLLLPVSDDAADWFASRETIRLDTDARALGLKGMDRTCDREKIEAILAIHSLDAGAIRPEMRNPCLDVHIPYYLGYLSYIRFHDGIGAAWYYLVTSAMHGAPVGISRLIGIMVGQGGEHIKSMGIFLTLAEGTPAYRAIAPRLSRYLGTGSVITESDIREVDGIFAVLGGQGDGYLAKGIRAFHLAWLDARDVDYFARYTKHAEDASVLVKSGIIGILPRDFDDIPWAVHRIVYIRDAVSGRWVARRGTYAQQ